jgi:hypothetical protein
MAMTSASIGCIGCSSSIGYHKHFRLVTNSLASFLHLDCPRRRIEVITSGSPMVLFLALPS